jgi:UDP-N-acetylglucosamine--N-acetylmuramyl-(pentapeptide) pyrophosphoryl-undecaprenol N-acetylglucosamine transferase
VPYPYAGRHQADNADYLARHGAALVIDNAELGEKLLPTISTLLEDDQKRTEMSHMARSLARPHAAECIAALLREWAE